MKCEICQLEVPEANMKIHMRRAHATQVQDDSAIGALASMQEQLLSTQAELAESKRLLGEAEEKRRGIQLPRPIQDKIDVQRRKENEVLVEVVSDISVEMNINGRKFSIRRGETNLVPAYVKEAYECHKKQMRQAEEARVCAMNLRRYVVT